MTIHRAAATTRSISVLLIVLSVAYAVEPLLSSGLARLDLSSLALTSGGLAAFCVLLVRVLWHGTRPEGEQSQPWPLVLSGIIAVAMYLRFGPTLSALPAVFAGAAAFLLSRWRAVAVVLVTVFSLVIAVVGHHPSWLEIVDLLGRALIVMAVVFAVGRVVVLTGELERNRADLARMAVLEERLRFARDLHDLLGHSLSVIALKGDVADHHPGPGGGHRADGRGSRDRPALSGRRPGARRWLSAPVAGSGARRCAQRAGSRRSALHDR